MYPFLRLAKELFINRNASPLPITGTHVSHHIIWPWDLDPWNELNNGRTLTIFDLGRIPLAVRTGLGRVLRQQGWGLTVAGNTTRYRRRVQGFQRVEMRSRCVGWDDRFFYLEQAMYRNGDCANHMLIRSAVIDIRARKMVPTAEVAAAIPGQPESPPLPDWITAWAEADKLRPWPPEMQAQSPETRRPSHGN